MLFASELFLTFIIYSFLGYLCEVLYCSLGARKLVNRGFLYGPILPIYGFGGMIVKLFLYPYKTSPFFVFFLAIILTSALEYVTSYLMEKLFNMKLWDYTTYKWNINGRVCLQNSLMFGGLSLLLTYEIEPRVESLLGSFRGVYLEVAAGLFFILFVVDIIFSVINAVGFEKLILSIDGLKEDLREERIKRIASKAKYQSFIKRYPGLKIKGKDEVVSRIKNKVLNIKEDIAELKGDLKDAKQDLIDFKDNVKVDFMEKSKERKERQEEREEELLRILKEKDEEIKKLKDKLKDKSDN